ncbi:HlyD family secretion protein [Shewanella yunxiaonensis]|uniref:HlyD family secretion protein n=1 Tax=Shewanella yunxiaonensis TaxID=2829809 RepID=A0ABX7YVG4_9GAMM|nr:HlyD family secretion protein [Shewanella yunxiaonensis]QUN06316.1 HlyD family secretion protein [Shewanella yunxiaonensis]
MSATDAIDENQISNNSRRKMKRLILLFVVPVLGVGAAVAFYLHGGRYVETDNAYVKADKTVISSEVAGKVIKVLVKENQPVAAGQLLFQIDPKSYQIAETEAAASLKDTADLLNVLKANVKTKLASIAAAKSQYQYLLREQQRKQNLLQQHYISDSDYDAARQDTEQEKLQIEALYTQLKLAVEGLGGDVNAPIESNAKYKKALAALDKARNDVQHVDIYAPSSGIVTHIVKDGEFVTPGSSAMLLVADSHLWVEANYTEKDLTYVRVGQDVEIKVDYQPDYIWHGVVSSLSPATGSEFSVIPAQNATGNWVKISQRLPIRIQIEPLPGAPQLRAGLSAEVTVDTKHVRHLTL